MKYSEWRLWFSSVPGPYKWFIYFILIRPIIDNFYFLKDISPVLSPLYIVGILTPILVLYSLQATPKSVTTEMDKRFKLWAFFLVMGLTFVLFNNIISVTYISIVLKSIIPVFIYFFCRRLIRSERDLDGVLQTFRYSVLFVIGMFVYEVVFHPFGYTDTRGGLTRIQGLYADVANYGMYFSLALLVNCYFFLKSNMTMKKIRNLLVIIVIFIVALVKINHAATYFVFTAVLGLFLMFTFRFRSFTGFIFIVIIALVFILYADTIREKSIDPLFKRDRMALEGELEESQLLHGRYGRWQMIFTNWIDFPIYAQLFGVPLMLDNSWDWMYGQSGTHNDFVRLMMLSGLLGVLVYLSILIMVLRKVMKQKGPMVFLGLATMTLLFLYSVSLTPTMYAFVMYVTMSIFAYMTLPKIEKHQTRDTKAIRFA